MTRVHARELAVRLMFSMQSSGLSLAETEDLFFSEEHISSLAEEDPLFSEYPDERTLAYIHRLTSLAEEHLPEIDAKIALYAKGRRIERISRTALAVLRCAICELLYMEDIPVGSAVNEAVEMGKTYDSPETASFINGILGTIIREEGIRRGSEPDSADDHE